LQFIYFLQNARYSVEEVLTSLDKFYVAAMAKTCKALITHD